jgi:hypothetical protein
VATWTYYAHNSGTGAPVAELPLNDVSIEDVLSGTSTLQATLPMYEPLAARAYCAPWLREITAVRDGVIAFHGPIVGRIPGYGKDGNTVQLSAASPQAYLYKRVTEALNHYNRDSFSIVRDLIDDATAKTGGSLYRLGYTGTDSGHTVELLVGLNDRRRVSQVIEDLASDNVTGFDFRWDYTWYDATNHLVQRTLTLDAPTIGRDLTASRVVEATADLVGITDAEDGMAAANRIHGLGGVVGTLKLRSVANSGSSLSAGYPLLEDVVDLSDINNQAVLDGITAHLRNSRIPGTRGFQSTHTISPHFVYDDVELGDLITLDLTAGVERLNVARRVTSIRTVPATDQVTFVYYDPTNAL